MCEALALKTSGLGLDTVGLVNITDSERLLNILLTKYFLYVSCLVMGEIMQNILYNVDSS